MRCLTLSQPWATLVAIKAKTVETRSWATRYRGPLAIHAAAGYGRGGARAHKALCGTRPFRTVLSAATANWLAARGDLCDMVAHPFMPLGAIVATCTLAGCVSTEHICDVLGAFGPDGTAMGRLFWRLTDQERAFGDYSPGRYAWLLADIRMLPVPIPAKGALSLWEWDGAIG